MGKTTIDIKPKPDDSSATIATDLPKKRGRPPKATSIQDALEPKKIEGANSNANAMEYKKKTYSLMQEPGPGQGNQSMFILPTKNTIIQLKITKEMVDDFEENGGKINMLLLEQNPVLHSEPLAYNESAIDYLAIKSAVLDTPPTTTTTTTAENLESANASSSSSSSKGFVNLLKLSKFKTNKPSTSTSTSTSINNTETMISDTEQRRNLIINSGVQRRVTKLMSAFSNTEWPNYSSYDCWYCCHSFSSAPVGIPEKLINDGMDKWTFQLYGNFCSYNCAARYLNPHEDNIDDCAMLESNFDLIHADEKSEQIQLLELLCNIETSKNMIEKIRLAPPRLSLKRFGGKLTIEEFRENFNQHTIYHVFKSPLVPISYELEEISGIQKNDKKNIPIDFNRVERAYRELSKQREQLKNKSSICKMLQKATSSK